MAENTPVQQPTDISQTLFSAGVLVEVNIGFWLANRKLRANDLLMEETLDSGVIYPGHKKLVPHESLHDIQNITGKARAVLDARSSPFPISGARFVSNHALYETLSTLAGLQSQFLAKVEEFIETYPALKEKQLAQLDAQAERIASEELRKAPEASRHNEWFRLKEWIDGQKQLNRSLYPTVEELRKKFYFRWRTFKISPMQGDEYAAINKEIDKDLVAWTKSTVAQIHKQLGERALATKEILEKSGKLNPRNLRPLLDAFLEFVSLDFTGSSKFRQVILDARERFFKKGPSGEIDYELTADMLNGNDSAKAELAQLLSKLGGLSSQPVAEKVGNDTLSASDAFRRLVSLE
jgi:hypothetical protein